MYLLILRDQSLTRPVQQEPILIGLSLSLSLPPYWPVSLCVSIQIVILERMHIHTISNLYYFCEEVNYISYKKKYELSLIFYLKELENTP